MTDAQDSAAAGAADQPADALPPVVSVSKLSDHVDQEVTIRGWLYNRRSKGKLHFLIIRDGSGIVQGVMFRGNVDDQLFEACGHIPQEASLIVTGCVGADARAPGGYELQLSGVEVVQAGEDYPISKQSHGPDFLLSNRHLWLRSRRQLAILRIRHEVIQSIRDFFYQRDFINVDAPILTPAACEGTSTLFELDYFDEGSAYLTQSGQLYMEAGAMAHGKVYCFGPTFRAERSKTRRHLTEFWMVEPEMAYADLDDTMQLAEDLLCHVVARVLERSAASLADLDRDTAPLEKVKAPFPRISYDEAVEILQSKGHDFTWGGDFGAPDETLLSESYDRPVMVHRYPAKVKAFYMKSDPADPRLALCVDVLAPEGKGEIIGGGQRADDLKFLEDKITEHKLPDEAFRWYLDLRRWGSVPHAGFGLGIERTVAWICGIEHVREAIPFPRMLYRIYP